MNDLVVDLGGIWTFVPEHGQPAPIQVPGGGWLKQGFTCEAGTYQTRLQVPEAGWPQATRLELGAVNHEATYYLLALEPAAGDRGAWRQVHTEVTAFTPQVVDLTPHVVPGSSYLLRIHVRAFRDGRPVAPHCAEWCESIARGIFRGAWLRVCPAVFVDDVFVRTSVEHRTLTAQVRVANTTARPCRVRLEATVSGDGSGADGALGVLGEFYALDLALPPNL